MSFPGNRAVPSAEQFADMPYDQLNREINDGRFVSILSTLNFAGGCMLMATDSLPHLVQGALSGSPVEIGYSALSFGIAGALAYTGKHGIETSESIIAAAKQERMFRREAGFAREAIE